ncbi:helix-turn-helix transcriptional regulator [Achromobacter ruhlandii]|uniref:helix-turn-helix transcriptional regulator n=1 Tax=Achromobacter ruhlandii TaxID=72557 RepID=UPI001EED8921|nr:AlpA family transcriptional regulator [Achromobacter ruhlandii]MCZ8395881.1 AlpA family transcriptional regulator [Achromobacter ruhlandii]
MTSESLIKLPQVIEKTGRGRTTIYTDPTFPKPVKIGTRAVAWVQSEVDAWIAQRIAASRGEIVSVYDRGVSL